MTLDNLERAQYVKVLSMLGKIQNLIQRYEKNLGKQLSPGLREAHTLIGQIIQILKETEEEE